MNTFFTDAIADAKKALADVEHLTGTQAIGEALQLVHTLHDVVSKVVAALEGPGEAQPSDPAQPSA